MMNAKPAKRWTAEEEGRAVSTFSPDWIASEGMAQVIGNMRRTDRNAQRKTDREAAHVARNGQASANRWY